MLHYYATTTLEKGSNPKKSKIKIKLKSPISIHHDTLLCNYFIGRGNQTKKNKKNQIKMTYIYTPCFTTMQLLHWKRESNQKK